ncbi:unnamed protein product [Rotaria magnacalcarata]|uniref:Glycophorin n=1 Tax=Rotaria magnacalcarata TaxID=392030 RepID=A0A815AS23_9BILA|nr:unnamed protein product [Rotaria magnacalcarata]
MKQILIILVLILIAKTQIISAHPIDNDTLSTSSTSSVESMNDTSTIDYEYNQAREVFAKPSPSRKFSILPVIIIGGALIGLGSVLVGVTIIIRKNESTKLAASTEILS